LLIPRSEVDSFLARKAEYNPVTIGGGELTTPEMRTPGGNRASAQY
jgi:hypothetical protein